MKPPLKICVALLLAMFAAPHAAAAIDPTQRSADTTPKKRNTAVSIVADRNEHYRQQTQVQDRVKRHCLG